MFLQREEAELARLEEEKAAEEKRRAQKAAKAAMDETLKQRRAEQVKQEQANLEFDRKMMEQLLAQSKAERQEKGQRKVLWYYFDIITRDSSYCCSAS